MNVPRLSRCAHNKAFFFTNRFRRDQAYRETHEKLADQFSQYHVIHIATREADEPKLHCQDVIQKNIIQERTHLELDPKITDIYLCGNPAMIGRPKTKEEMKVYPQPTGIVEILEKKGFIMSTPRQPGNIHFEAYW